jgi:enoyl-CoA hydratase/carnithine racemase
LTLTETREAIMAAETGAQAIDSFLRALAVLRPLTGVEYSAEDSLAAGLVDAADSLEPLPTDFAELGAQISAFSGNVDQMEAELEGLAEEMAELADGLERAAQALRRQGQDLGELADGMGAAKPLIARWSNVLGWATGLLFVWILITQYGLFSLGRMLLEDAERAQDVGVPV